MKIEELVSLKINPEKYGRVAVLMGGPYAEREVSLMSGNAVVKALKDANLDVYGIDADGSLPEKLLKDNPDRIFLAMHGTYGEDGTVQGLLETLKIPYTGSSVLASALAMNKEKSKLIWKALGIPTLDFIVSDGQIQYAQVAERFDLPFAVKPIAEGSSVGITRVDSENDFRMAVDKALKFEKEILIEPWIDGKELTVGIIGESALPIIRITTPVGFYDYEAKYFSEQTQYNIPSGLSTLKEEELKNLAIRAYQSLGCRHWGRVDAILDNKGQIWLLEVNTIPGLTSHSLVPQAAAALGIDFQTLVLSILKQTL